MPLLLLPHQDWEPIWDLVGSTSRNILCSWVADMAMLGRVALCKLPTEPPRDHPKGDWGAEGNGEYGGLLGWWPPQAAMVLRLAVSVPLHRGLLRCPALRGTGWNMPQTLSANPHQNMTSVTSWIRSWRMDARNHEDLPRQ
ncbi:hypothetical protein NDU88_003525 [Pleurodeles waltl]|uniref:Uncharacterized protein n=1 Tax=Pleurodeles waltl TaxID=8319 RepID=A0AAV7KV47_PLEWA|nr:hypothetical protein NDU88_003525 [Pleurodeles waltl]